MKLRAQEITLPCVSFKLRVRLGEPSGKLTPIELITLKAIAAGVEDVSELSRILRFGKRPMLDLIYDFWLKGYVMVDTDNATVQLTGAAADAQRDGNLAALASAENHHESVSLLQEMVSGAVLPDVGQRSPPGPESALVPTRLGGLDLGLVSPEARLDALQDAVEKQERANQRQRRVLEAWIDPTQYPQQSSDGFDLPTEWRYLPLVVDVSLAAGSGLLVFEIIDGPALTPVIRRGVESGLTALAKDFPEHLFFRQLRERIERQGEADGLPVDTMGPLMRAIDGLEGIDPGVLERRHSDLTWLYKAGHDELQLQVRAQGKARAVVGDAAHEEIIGRMLEEASRQVVLANPWIKLAAINQPRPALGGRSWLDLISAGLARGVQIVVLWGFDADAELPSDVRNAFMHLRQTHQNRFRWSERPSVIHAKFAICDASEALLTSYNYLNRPGQHEKLEVGLAVAGEAPRQTNAALLELLRWVRDRFPDHAMSQGIVVLAGDLASVEPAKPPWQVPQCPTGETLHGPDGAATIRHWVSAWRAAADALVAARQRCRHPVALIVDRAHRDALAHGLQHSARRMAILSDQVSVDVVTDGFAADLGRRLTTGIACALVFQHEGASDTADGPAARLRRLVAQHRGKLSLIEAKSHAKILVVDDDVMIGSFNFLSFGSDYKRSARIERAELSFHVRDPAVVEVVLAALAEHWPVAFSPLLARGAPTVALPSARGAPPSIQPLFQRLRGGQDPGDVLIAWFTDRAERWQDLAVLREVRVAEPLLVRAVSAALAQADDLEGADALCWRGWLAEQRWQAGDFVGSALLAPPATPGPLGLERWLARLGAAIEAPKLAAEAPMEVPAHDGQRAAVALLGVVDLLVHGRAGLVPLLERAMVNLPRHLQRWVRAAIAYHATGRGSLPLALLQRSADRQVHQQEVERARSRFAEALASAESVSFRFPVGQHTWDRMRTPKYPLGSMRAALDTDDAGGLGRYFDALTQDGTDLAAIMDEVSYELRDVHNQRIIEPKRSVCLKRLRHAQVAAGRWVDLARDAQPSVDEVHQLAACREVRKALDDVTSVASTPLAPLAEPVRGFVIDRLKPLLGTELA